MSKSHPRHASPEQIEEMCRLHRSGFSCQSIGTRVGFTESTVRKHVEASVRLEDDPINRLLMATMSEWSNVI